MPGMGPLPDPNRRRRNAPTIPTTALPVGGRKAAAPRIPSWCPLGKAGKAWWGWAWKTPQAAAWAPGHESLIARRAALEDDLAALAAVEGLDLVEILDEEFAVEVRRVIQRLAALATGRLAVLREMRELDDRLGLSPKGMAALRWEVVGDGAPAAAGGSEGDEVGRRRTRRAGLLAG